MALFETGQQSDMILHIGKIVTDKESTVFYLTGLGGKLDTGLGQALRDLGVTYSGISYSGAFSYLGLTGQVEYIKTDLSKFVADGGQKVVAVSAGGYLIVKLLEEYDFSNLDILLLSPGLPENIVIPIQPRSLRIIFGSEDRMYHKPAVEKLLRSVSNSSSMVVNDAGHDIPHDIVRDELVSLI